MEIFNLARSKPYSPVGRKHSSWASVRNGHQRQYHYLSATNQKEFTENPKNPFSSSLEEIKKVPVLFRFTAVELALPMRFQVMDSICKSLS